MTDNFAQLEALGPYTANSEQGRSLTFADLQRTYDLLKSIKPKLYYALSEYLPDKSVIYKIPSVFVSEEYIWILDPELFPEFEFHATQAGYQLIDYKDVSLDELSFSNGSFNKST